MDRCTEERNPGPPSGLHSPPALDSQGLVVSVNGSSNVGLV